MTGIARMSPSFWVRAMGGGRARTTQRTVLNCHPAGARVWVARVAKDKTQLMIKQLQALS